MQPCACKVLCYSKKEVSMIPKQYFRRARYQALITQSMQHFSVSLPTCAKMALRPSVLQLVQQAPKYRPIPVCFVRYVP
jgi:hypothetical protein